MNSAAIALCLALFASVAGGATVEISTEGWTGSGNTNGWKFANLGSDGAMGAGSFIESPRWTDADILSAMVNVRCSTNQPDRIPQITFCYDDSQTARAIRLNPVTKEVRLDSQAFDTNPDRHAKGLRLALAETGTAVWIVRSIVLDYEGSLEKIAPEPEPEPETTPEANPDPEPTPTTKPDSEQEPDHVPGFVIFIK